MASSILQKYVGINHVYILVRLTVWQTLPETASSPLKLSRPSEYTFLVMSHPEENALYGRLTKNWLRASISSKRTNVDRRNGK